MKLSGPMTFKLTLKQRLTTISVAFLTSIGGLYL